MITRDDVRTIVGVLGNIISFFLFLSPSPTFKRIIKAKAVQEFKPDPYLATVLNCMIWVLYGLPIVHPNSILVLTINAAGLVIEFAYVTIFFIYSPWSKRAKILIILTVEAIFVTLLVFFTLYFIHDTKGRSTVVGIFAILFNIAMYASPLTVMRMVIKTKSVKYMPFYLSLFSCINGIVWVVYASLRLDPFILIPNGLGALSGIIQIGLYCAYYRTTKWDYDEEQGETAGEIQVSNNI